MSEAPTQRDNLTVHERRAKIIAQLHADATATANGLAARRRVTKKNVAQNARSQKATAWQFGAGIVLWVLAVGYLIVHLP
jgi:hypothetical protein